MIRQGLNISSFRGIYTTEKQNYFIRYLLLFSLLFWCAGFFLPAFSLEFTGISFIHFAVKSIYSTVCNQSNTATFSVNDHLLFVCARCTGLYLGAFTAAVFSFFIKNKVDLSLKPLIIFSLPMLIDALSVRLNIYDYSKIVAFITGILCGSIIFIYILEVLENSLTSFYKKKI